MSSSPPIRISAEESSWPRERRERSSCARLLEQPRQHAAGVEVLVRDFGGAFRVALVVAVHRVDGRERLFGCRKGEQPASGRKMRGPSGVLHDGGPPRREITLGAIAEP